MTGQERGLFSRRHPPVQDDEQHDIEKQRPLENDEKVSNTGVSLRQRIKHLTWAWFTLPMSTGGITLLLADTPHRFPGLNTIGKIFFIFDIVVFLLLCAAITARFVLFPGTLRKSLTHPTEALFFPTFWLALVNVFNATQQYGGPYTGEWLNVVERVLFWIYVALTFLVAVVQYVQLFRAKRLTIQSMTPAWILPAFPVMLSGTFASVIAPTQPIVHRWPILVAGLTFQGLGWTISFMVFSIYLNRLIQFGLPAPNLRPGMFIAVGPPSFTSLALMGISQALPPESYYFQNRPGAVMTLQAIADFTAIFLWCLSFWFFCVTLISVLAGAQRMEFHLIWWAFVFPNVGFTLATTSIGKQLNSEAILWVASAMAILLVVMWIFVLYSHVKAVMTKKIMMFGRDEDKDQYKEDDEKHNIPIPPEIRNLPH